MALAVEPEALCAIDGCINAKRKRGWCDRHYQAWRRHGSPMAAKYEWAPKADSCVLCGNSELKPGSRSYCSSACVQAAYRARQRGWSWEPRPCARCGTTITMERQDGRFATSVLKRFCTGCLAPRRSYRLAVKLLAHYQGAVCRVCDDPIDMDVKFPEPMSASVDHIVPLAYGGTDDVENLQLAHFSCNSKKKVRRM